MRLVALDTNIIVSAGIRPVGVPAKIIMDWVLEGRVQVVISPWIIDEYRGVVNREKFRRYGFPPQWLDFLIEGSLCIPDPSPWPHPVPDPKDAPFLALANATGAWLVTGNLKHFEESIREGVVVLSPRDYLDYLSGTGRA
jgi:putative PIN family toxin of toxin-antitoxin system